MKKLIILSGAGMSAESGIATFRDAGGLWEEHRIEDVATPEGWNANPALVHQFYNLRREQLLKSNPNAGHYGLVALEQHFDVKIITQNVDNLHERAGSKWVLHLHGELMKMRSSGPSEEVFEVQPEQLAYKIDDVCPKGYPLRPHIVWFGEAVPNYDLALEMVQTADILVIVGTSMQVYPAAGLLHYVQSETPVYLIDPNDVEVFRDNIHLIKAGASEGIKTLTSMLMHPSDQ